MTFECCINPPSHSFFLLTHDTKSKQSVKNKTYSIQSLFDIEKRYIYSVSHIQHETNENNN